MMRQFGKSIAEYGLILALVILVAIPAVTYLGSVISDSFNNNGDIQSKGSELFSLLGGGGGGGGGGDTSVASASSPFPGLSSEGQPVDNIYFNYDPQTGMVQVILPDGTATGTPSTSADGTKILAQNLKQILEENQGSFTPMETAQLNRISDIAMNLAEEERKLLEKFPQLKNGPANAEGVALLGTLNQNMWGQISVQESAFIRNYQDFSQEYEVLKSKLATRPELAPLAEEIETNAALVSQLAYKNFLSVYENPKNTRTQSRTEQSIASQYLTDAQKKKIQGDVDITGITAEETPAVTERAGNVIRTAENQAQNLMKGASGSSATGTVQ